MYGNSKSEGFGFFAGFVGLVVLVFGWGGFCAYADHSTRPSLDWAATNGGA